MYNFYFFNLFILVNSYKKYNKATYLLNYHIIWCPKYRRGLLTGEIKNRLEEIINEVVYERRNNILSMEIMPDHIHLLISTRHDEMPYKLIKSLKGRTSNLLRKEFPQLLKMPTLWSRSYFISSVGNVSSSKVKEYIENQWRK